MSALRDELEREREAYTADPADCEPCRFSPSGRCRFHAEIEAEILLQYGEETVIQRGWKQSAMVVRNETAPAGSTAEATKEGRVR